MNKSITKQFFVYDFEKLENWLNQMADDGWALSSIELYGFSVTNGKKTRYNFTKTEKGEYKYRVLLLDKPHTYYDAHKQTNFVASTGAEFVGHFNRFAIFRQKSELDEFNLYSDNDSQIKYVSKLLKSFVAYSIFTLLFAVLSIILLLPPNHFIVVIDIALLCLLYLGFGIYNIVGIVKMSRKLKELKAQATLFE